MSEFHRTKPDFLDQESMAGFRKGDKDCFREVFEIMSRPLTYFVRQIIFSEIEVEDIVAKAFSKLYIVRERMVSFEHIRRWLYVTVRNESIDYLRTRKRRIDSQAELAYLESDTESHFETERVKTEVFRLILAEVEKLPKQRKAVLRAYFFEKKSTGEIAEEFGLDTQTVLNHKAKALEALRKKLPHYGDISILLTAFYTWTSFR